MQELVSIISIILGVVVLTAWAMWIVLRPSGDNKVQEFASESARDGITLTMIENNELKNKVTRLERELKVLMGAGYRHAEKLAAEESGKKKDDEEVKGKSLKTKDEGQKTKDKELNSRHEVKPSEELKASWKGTEDRGTIVDQRSSHRTDAKPGEKGKAASPVGGAPRGEDSNVGAVEGKISEKSKAKSLKAVRKEKVKGERLKAKDERKKVEEKADVVGLPVGVASRGEDFPQSKEERQSSEKTKAESEKVEEKKGAGSYPVGGAPRGEDLFQSKEERQSSEKTKVESLKTKDERPKTKPAEYIQSAGVSALSESQRITDKKEKKKIAAYLASVAETTERQMKEVEALEEDDEPEETVAQYPDEDLKKIKGIGPHLEGKLKKAGITSYQQIAELSDSDMQGVAKEIGYFPRRIKRDEWVEQAQVLVQK